MALRKTDVQDAILRWLLDQEDRGIDRSFRDIEAIRPYLGENGYTFDLSDYGPASLELEKLELVEGVASWGGGLHRLSLTARGRILVESGQSVRTYVPGSQSVNPSISIGQFNNNGGAAVVGHQNSHINQQVTNGVSGEKITELVALLRDYVAAGPSNSEEVSWLTDSIEEAAAEPEANKGMLRKLIERVRTKASEQMIPILSDEIVAIGGEVLNQLTS